MHNSFGCFKQERGEEAGADDANKQKSDTGSKWAVLCLKSKPMKFNVRHQEDGGGGAGGGIRGTKDFDNTVWPESEE